MSEDLRYRSREIGGLIESCGFEIAESTIVQGHSPQYLPVPNRLHPAVFAYLKRQYPSGLYAHQARAIDAALDAADVCLATPTASGKSLVFMSLAANLIKRDPNATVVALYPAKALIQDQLTKWRELLTNFSCEPGYIDGAVSTASRPQIFANHRVILMTPDVTHAWVMSHLQDPAVASFLGRLCLLVLDEAHVYDGVFGTNMAYFLRRLQRVSRPFKIVASTATIGEPETFLRRLTGRQPVTFGATEDGSAAPNKTVFVMPGRGDKTFEGMTALLSALARGDYGRFLAFADSRRMVEQLVAVATRDPKESETDEDVHRTGGRHGDHAAKILPYRAGYEEEDRSEIQDALGRGALAGVVSTSAMELGLDIGSIDIVLLLGTPPTVKAFWQRIGRGGRRTDGICAVIDTLGLILGEPNGLAGYMNRAPEPGWLYLDNRFILYANVLCAAVEASSSTRKEVDPSVFSSLPQEFAALLENELNPAEMVPEELYPLKQRAQAGPHYEFPLRSGIEKNFEIKGGGGGPASLGTATLSQALREAYPGAVYYYMARPYRVIQFNYRSGQIVVRPEKRYTTVPIALNMVFPKFPGGILSLAKSNNGFVTESEIQVSERVTGFREKRGANSITNLYEGGSPYSQQPVNRFFETTGVCWYFTDSSLLTESVATAILQAFCSTCGVQSRDVGLGIFHTNVSPLDGAPCKGVAIYDATHGSLRLTQQLADRFGEIVEAAEGLLRSREKRDIVVEIGLHALAAEVAELQPEGQSTELQPALATDWVRVIEPGQKAMRVLDTGASEEVEIKGYRYTPQGLMYDLVASRADVNWAVKAALIRPLHGQTAMVEVNLVTGAKRVAQTVAQKAPGDGNLESLTRRSEEYVAKQFGSGQKWAAIARGICAAIQRRTEHSISLTDVEAVATSLSAGSNEVLAVLALLSGPGAALLRMDYVRQDGETPSQVPPEEVSQMMRAWWRDRTLADDEWHAWAAKVAVRWSAAGVHEIAP